LIKLNTLFITKAVSRQVLKLSVDPTGFARPKAAGSKARID
jgi:hypothetical protein